mgnify:CR=1 FL=1
MRCLIVFACNHATFSVQTKEISTDDVFSKARANDIEAVQAILEADFDIDSVDENGNTLLHVAAQQVMAIWYRSRGVPF